MKTLNKNLLACAKIASSNKIRPVLACVYITNDKMVTTDSYSILEIKNYSKFDSTDFPVIQGCEHVKELKEEGILLNAKDIIEKVKFRKSKSKNLPILGEAVLTNETENTISIVSTDLSTNNIISFGKKDGNFPDYSRIIPTKEPISQGFIDLEKLKKMCEAFLLAGKTSVRLKLYNEKGEKPCPIMFENDNVTGLIMPLTSQTPDKH